MKSLSFDEAHEKMAEQIKNGVEPKIVNCFGGAKFEFMGEGKETKKRIDGKKRLKKYLRIRLFNEKVKCWQYYKIVEHYAPCPVCGKLLLVRAIKGSTYFYACNKEHSDQAWAEHLELMEKHMIKTSATTPELPMMKEFNFNYIM